MSRAVILHAGRGCVAGAAAGARARNHNPATRAASAGKGESDLMARTRAIREAVSATEPDWRREHKRAFEWSPSRSLLASLRSYQRWRGSRHPLRWPAMKWAVLRHRFWSMVTGAEIPLNCRIGGGLLIPHPNGIVIHPDAVIGPNCLILQQVTIGTAGGDAPTIGGRVDLGAGAKVLGAVRVGDQAQVGANAVVLHDLPAGCVAVGVPARILPSTAPLHAVRSEESAVG